MNPTELTNRLLQAKKSTNFLPDVESIFDDLALDGIDLEFVRVILRFMEQNPTLDYGAPGPLVHFVEKFYGRGYEAELLASISRCPVCHTIWMLNRVINGTKREDDRNRLIDALRAAIKHPSADIQTKNLITRFLQNLTREAG